MPKIIILLISSIVLAACATSDPYRAASGSGFGYTDTKIAEDRARVTFKLRGDNKDLASKFALRRAAEVTQAAGKEWFVITNRFTEVERDRGSPSVSQSGSTVVRDCGLLGCTTSRTASTAVVIEGPQTSEVEAEIEFTMGQGKKPASDDTYYDAASVLAGSKGL